jgi:hypothetical protein
MWLALTEVCWTTSTGATTVRTTDTEDEKIDEI